MAREFNTIGVTGDISPGPTSYVHSNANWVGATDRTLPSGTGDADSIGYNPGDIVHHDGSIWVARIANDNVTPNSTNTDEWELIGNASSRFLLNDASEGSFGITSASAIQEAATDGDFDYGILFIADTADIATEYVRSVLNTFQIANVDSLTIDDTVRTVTTTTEYQIRPLDENTNAPLGFYANGDAAVVPPNTGISYSSTPFVGTQRLVRINIINIPLVNNILTNAPGANIIFGSLITQSDAIVTGSELIITPENPLVGTVSGEDGNVFNLGISDNSISNQFITPGTVTPAEVNEDIATQNDLARSGFTTREVQRVTVTGNTANSPSDSSSTDTVITFRLPSDYSAGETTNYGPNNDISLDITTDGALQDTLAFPSTGNIVSNFNNITNLRNSIGFANSANPVSDLTSLTALQSGTEWSDLNTIIFNRVNLPAAAEAVVNTLNDITTATNRIVLIYCDDNNWATYLVPPLSADQQSSARTSGGAAIFFAGRSVENISGLQASLGTLIDNPTIYVANTTTVPTETRAVGRFEFTIDTTMGSPFLDRGIYSMAPMSGTIALDFMPTVSNMISTPATARQALTQIGSAITDAYGTGVSQGTTPVEVRPIVTENDDNTLTMDVHTHRSGTVSTFVISGYNYIIRNAQGVIQGNIMETQGGDIPFSVATLQPPNREYALTIELPPTETRTTFIQRVITEVMQENPSDAELRANFRSIRNAWNVIASGDDTIVFQSLLGDDNPNLWLITIDHGSVTTAGRLGIGEVIEESRAGRNILGLTPDSPQNDFGTITTVPNYIIPNNAASSYLVNVDDTNTDVAITWQRHDFALNNVAPSTGHQVLRTLTFNGVTYDIAASSVNPRAVAFFDNEDQDATLAGYSAGDTSGSTTHYNLVYDITIRNVNTSATNLLANHQLTFGPRGGTMTTLNQSMSTSVMTAEENTIIRRFMVNILQQRPVRGTASDNIIFDFNFTGMFPDAEEPNELDSIDISTTLTFTDQRQPITVTPSRIAKSLFDSTRDTFTVNYPRSTGPAGTVYDTNNGVFNVAIGTGNPTEVVSQTNTYQPPLVAADTNYTFSFPLNAVAGSNPPESSNGQRTTAPNVMTTVDIYTPYYFGEAAPAQIALLTGTTATPDDIDDHLTSSTKDLEDMDVFTVTGGRTDVGNQIYVAFDSSISTPELQTSNGFVLQGVSVGTITVNNAITGTTTLNVFRYGEYTRNETYTIIGGS